MYPVTNVKNLLRSHGYAPVVRKVGDGIIATFPRPRLTRPHVPEISKAYAVKRGQESGLYYNSSLAPEEKFMSLGEHAVRLFLMSDIVWHCKRVPIAVDTVCFLDEGGEDHGTIEEIVDAPSTEEERAKEGFLRGLFMEAREDGFPSDFEGVAMNHGVYDGYRLIKAFFEG